MQDEVSCVDGCIMWFVVFSLDSIAGLIFAYTSFDPHAMDA